MIGDAGHVHLQSLEPAKCIEISNMYIHGRIRFGRLPNRSHQDPMPVHCANCVTHQSPVLHDIYLMRGIYFTLSAEVRDANVTG